MTVDDVQPPEGRGPIRVWLEFDLNAQPIEGTLGRPGERPSPFSGWLGLTTALEGMGRPRGKTGEDETQ